MADSPWLVLRQAQEAVANHRPEEAHKLIEPLIAEGYRKAWRLARDIVKDYTSRAAKFLDQHNPDAAWRDLLAAEALNTGEKVVAELRQTLARLGLVQARAALEAGNPPETITLIGKLRDRGVRHPDLNKLEEAAQDWGLASELADRGEFLRSIAELDKLRPKLPCPVGVFNAFRTNVEDRHTRFRSAVGRLYDAAEARLWREALTAAEEVLTVAPEHREAKAIRGKAWLAAAPDTVDYLATKQGDSERQRESESISAPSTKHSTLPYSNAPNTPSSSSGSKSSSGQGSTNPMLPKRFLLWVDGVGGYLVCLSNRVTFGQATGDGPVDVPLFADVSRLHAEISRDGEGYVVESGKSVLVNGNEVKRSVLSPGDRVTLGATCQFLFHKPVAISSTARLELTSGHRLPVAVDGVLLMGNEVMLGPGPDAHVFLPDVPAPISIYRSKEGLGVRVPTGTFRVDERPYTDRATLSLPAVVTAETFTFAIEPVAARL
jgi:tetratricopeptide (TPR) repeat protein